MGDLDPVQGVQRISELVRQWFPAAFETGTPPLPPAPDFQHMFLGLCTLADWIGSNQEWFPFCDQPDSQYMDRARSISEYAIRKVGLDLSGQRAALASEGPDFSSLFQFSPNAIQQAAVDDTPLNEQLAIIESETGSGKTEAALWRFANMYREGLVDGLYFALPTRSAAAQLHRRVKSFVENLFPAGHTPPGVLAVPAYDAEEDADPVTLEYDSHSAGHREGEEKALGIGGSQALPSVADCRRNSGPSDDGGTQSEACSHAGGLPSTQPARSGRGARLGHVHATHPQGPPRLPSQCRRVCPVDVCHVGFRGPHILVIQPPPHHR